MSEQARLDALADYEVLDTPAEQSFDRLTRLATDIFDVPMSTITFIDGHRQWFKSRQGMQACETEREPAFCNVTIQHTRPLVVPDAAADERFSENPFVRGAPHIRFYAGIPLRSPAGQAVGSICAMDRKPRVFSERDTAVLAELAGLAIDLLEMQKRLRKAESGGREAPKSRVLQAGRLHFMRSAMACTIRSLSSTEASVGVIDAAAIPDRVALVIDMEGVSRLCRVSARNLGSLDLAFES
ncbi:GAF domain-containing protein [Bosea sp. RCC_152_1]|uniref:GAF domain-containing protein n=1 Tax=Bosea sp. RCC_152_1 TaxID=3239228 RepID=UPI00352647E0